LGQNTQIDYSLTIAFTEPVVGDSDVVIVLAGVVLEFAVVAICLPVGTTNFTEGLVSALVRAVTRAGTLGLPVFIENTDLVEVALVISTFSLGI